MLKTPKAIMDAARGEPCTANIYGVCNYDPETTVFAHHPDGQGGSNKLSGPLTGGFACSECHNAFDGRNKKLKCLSGDDKDFYMRRSMFRTLNRLIELGYVTVKGLK